MRRRSTHRHGLNVDGSLKAHAAIHAYGASTLLAVRGRQDGHVQPRWIDSGFNMTRIRSRRVVILVVLFTALAMSSFTASASALYIRWYSFDSSCTFRRDPITTIFYYRGYAEWTSTHLGHHTGWGDTWADGGSQ